MTAEQLLELVDGLEANGLLAQYSHLLTGYIGSEALLQAVVQVATKLAAHNPDLIYVCDPVMGDHGRLYVSPQIPGAFRGVILPIASVVTPNQFEAEQLAGLRIAMEADALAACAAIHTKGPHTVVRPRGRERSRPPAALAGPPGWQAHAAESPAGLNGPACCTCR